MAPHIYILFIYHARYSCAYADIGIFDLFGFPAPDTKSSLYPDVNMAYSLSLN